MKILFISPFFYPHSGGAEKYAEELFSKLIIDHPDIEVDIICYNTNEAPETEAYKGMKIYRVTAFNLLKQQFYLPNLFDLIKRLRLLKNNKYDYVGTQTRFFDATWWTWIYARYVHAESFFIGHGTGFVSHSSALVRAIAKIVDLSIAKLALKMYSKVIVISKSTQDFFENVLGVKDTQLIYGGVDTSLFEVDPKMKLSRRIPKIDQQISDDSIIITYLGRLIWAKGLRELLHAYKETISQINAETMLVIAGAGELSNELKSQVQRLAISDSVIFTGNLEYEDAVHLFNISDIFVHPSFNEGLPRVVLESAAAGNAVIATDVGSTKEIINSQTGILIEPKNTQQITNSLIQLINQPELRKKLGKDAKLHVKRYFDWHVITQQFYDFLQE